MTENVEGQLLITRERDRRIQSTNQSAANNFAMVRGRREEEEGRENEVIW